MASISTRYSGLASDDTTSRVLAGAGAGKNPLRTSATGRTILEAGQVQGGSGNVGHTATGRLDHPLQIGENLARLSRGVVTPDQLSVLVEGDLTRDEEETPRCDDPMGVVPGRGGMSRHLDRCSFKFFSHPPNLSVSLLTARCRMRYRSQSID